MYVDMHIHTYLYITYICKFVYTYPVHDPLRMVVEGCEGRQNDVQFLLSVKSILKSAAHRSLPKNLAKSKPGSDWTCGEGSSSPLKLGPTVLVGSSSPSRLQS